MRIYVLNNAYVEEEMVRAGVSLMPYLVVGFVIMVICSVTSVMLRAAYMHQNNGYKVDTTGNRNLPVPILVSWDNTVRCTSVCL
jgi:hypothetical protein